MNQERWKSFYKKADRGATWVKVMLSNGDHHFFSNHNHKNWLFIKTFCDEFKTKISEMELQFRSHRVTIDIDSEVEAVYFCPSVMGLVGSSSKNYFTVGLLKRGIVYKKMWLIPELVVEKEIEDEIYNCFEEAMIYHEKTQEKRKE